MWEQVAWRGLILTALTRAAIAMPHPASFPQSTNALMPRAGDEDFLPDDLSHINSIAAIGDSYSAGIGAGNRLGGFSLFTQSGMSMTCPALLRY